MISWHGLGVRAKRDRDISGMVGERRGWSEKQKEGKTKGN